MPIPLAIPIIMAAMGAASSIGGGIMGARENKKNQSLINQRNAELQRDLYQGVLDDSGSKAYLRTLDRNLRDTIQGVENSAVSTGATQENVLAQKQAANEAVSDAIGNLLEREDNKRYYLLNRQNNIDAQQMSLNAQKGQNWQQIAQGVSNAASALGSAYMLGEQKLFNGNQSSNPVGDMNNYGAKLAQEGLNDTIAGQAYGWRAKPLNL